MKVLKKSILWFGVLSIVWAQTPGTQTTLNAETSAQLAEGKQTVAILDFEGRGYISDGSGHPHGQAHE